MYSSCLLILTLWQTTPLVVKPTLPLVEMGDLLMHYGKVQQLFLTFPQAPKKGGRVLVMVPANGQHAELDIQAVKPNEMEGFDVSLDLSPLKLTGDGKLEYSYQDVVAIYPVPKVMPALVKLSPATCPKMIHPSQVQACLDMDLDGKPDLLLANCCGKGYAFDEEKRVYCNDDLTSQCRWQWQGKSWKLVYQRLPC